MTPYGSRLVVGLPRRVFKDFHCGTLISELATTLWIFCLVVVPRLSFSIFLSPLPFSVYLHTRRWFILVPIHTSIYLLDRLCSCPCCGCQIKPSPPTSGFRRPVLIFSPPILFGPALKAGSAPRLYCHKFIAYCRVA
ncbi:hypothetical protein VTK73DRAFT_6688 [Phialemonium thermophilum]|uniref:Uncharacterized protein n=1 Tax=Phialemonium thermophilum TaxID=223376 RepID=A0ABR3WI92_9PEZI